MSGNAREVIRFGVIRLHPQLGHLSVCLGAGIFFRHRNLRLVSFTKELHHVAQLISPMDEYEDFLVPS
jgi:hypothetical protein